MKDKSISITEIAHMAHVHPSTVSRALNGSPLVKEATRREIAAIAQKYNYTPDAVAKSLQLGRTSTVGVIVPEIANAFYACIVDAVEQIMVSQGYSLILAGTRFDPQAELRAVQTMCTKRVDALVVCAPSAEAEQALTALAGRMPVILCDPLHESAALDSVRVDEQAGIARAADYLIRRGYTDAGCIADRVTTHRMALFTRAMAARGFPVRPEALYTGSTLAEPCGYAGLMALEGRSVLPAAVFAARDTIAAGVMRAAIERGLDIPGRLAIIGYDGSSTSGYLYKKLTTVRQPADEIGRNVARLLLRRLNAQTPPEPEQVCLAPELLVCESA